MKNNKRNRRTPSRWIQAKRGGNVTKETVGFASTKSYVEAVSKIYYQEINDIGRFVKFAESYSSKAK